MADKLEVVPGPGLVARFGEVEVWAGPQATPLLQSHLVSEAQRASQSPSGGDQLASSLIAILQRGDPEPQAPFAVVGPGANGLTLFLHGPVQAWDSGRWLAPQPVPGWMVTSIGRPWPLIVLPYGSHPPPQSQQGNPLDLVTGAVPGAGFVLLRPPSAPPQPSGAYQTVGSPQPSLTGQPPQNGPTLSSRPTSSERANQARPVRTGRLPAAWPAARRLRGSRLPVAHCRVAHCRVAHCRVAHCRVAHCRVAHCRVAHCRVAHCRVAHCRVAHCRVAHCPVARLRGAWRLSPHLHPPWRRPYRRGALRELKGARSTCVWPPCPGKALAVGGQRRQPHRRPARGPRRTLRERSLQPSEGRELPALRAAHPGWHPPVQRAPAVDRRPVG